MASREALPVNPNLHMPPTEPHTGVRLQNLRDFTVQIRSPADGQIAGTGIAVDREGQVVTCAHVVRAILGVHPREAAGDAEVGVYFPQARGGEQKDRRATVAGCFPQHDDDVVLLQLTGGPPPLGPEQMPALGRAEDSCYHGFRTYGYRSLGHHQAAHGHGLVVGCVERFDDDNLLAEPVQLESQHIDKRMSGAAVLDVERNLVVGFIAGLWQPRRGSPRDRDLGWAVNARVLSLTPLNLPLRDTPLAKGTAPPLRLEEDQIAAARAAAHPAPGAAWNNAPPTLVEWTGRDELLRALDRDWAHPARRVTGLIGFGGEGKSSLARQWVETLLARPLSSYASAGSRPRVLGTSGAAVTPTPCARGQEAADVPSTLGRDPRRTREGKVKPPDGVFWWGFYEKPSVDEFFEAALQWLGGGRIDPRRLPGTSMRAQVVGAMLGAGRYLLVLDGLEVMQHQDGDSYGLLRSADLRAFLERFAAPEHGSFCLLTSRAPVLDLMAFTTYTHRDVERLSPGDGRALLRKLGVHGAGEALDRAVADWDGHALTLSLLGSYLADRYDGDAARLDDIPPPTAEEQRYARVHRVLRRYDEHLGEAERAFLTLFSAFRTPVHESAFDKVFRAPVHRRGEVPSPPEGGETPPLQAPLAAMGDDEFAAMVERLVQYRLLRYDKREEAYTAHPLVRNHYFALLTRGEMAGQQDAHARIKDYYLEVAGDTPHFPTLDDLAPLIEVVYHACRAGAYDEAHTIRRDRIDRGTTFVVCHQLGAHETELALMRGFFPEGDFSKEPQTSDPSATSFILNMVGYCLMSLGRLGEAAPFFQRYVAGNIELEDWHNASVGYRNLAELHAHLGALGASADAAGEALALARRAGNKQDEQWSLEWTAWAAHLQGNLEEASKIYRQAEALQREREPSTRFLYSLDGIHHADHLRRTGRAEDARRVTEANLEICERNRWANQISWCHRVLGDLDAGDGEHAGARAHYDQALKIARGISVRDVLIEALLARGRWAARHAQADLDQAFADLDEALGLILEGGYKVYEADARVALAWTHRATGESRAPSAARARAEAQRARQLSAEMGYHWGQVDAEEVLAALDAESPDH